MFQVYTGAYSAANGKQASLATFLVGASVFTTASEKFQTSPSQYTRQPHASGATAVQKTPADAAVERLFSFAKATLSDLRTSLSPELFEAMVFVAQNADQLEFTWEEVFDEYKKLLREAAAAAAAAT